MSDYQRKKPMKYFAIHLLAMRNKKGWDQEITAHMSGLSTRTIQRIEAGNSCSLDTLKSLAAALDLTHFSSLLPEPKDNRYIPKWSDFWSAAFYKLVVLNTLYSVIFWLMLLGIGMYIQISESALPIEELSIKEQITKLHDFHKTAGMPTLTDEQALAHIEKRNKPLTADNWKEYESFMFFLFYLVLVGMFVFRLAWFTRTYEFYYLIGKPAKEYVITIFNLKMA